MISFYPGPSRIDKGIPAYLREAAQSGILSVNHRSQTFEKLYQQTLQNFRKALQLPADYTLLFTSSATECWEIVAQSLIGSEKSLHLYNGAFGEKWQQYTHKITKQTVSQSFGLNELPPTQNFSGYSVICFTHNETSNGTYWPNPQIKKLRKENPDALLVADATSSMAGIKIDFTLADVWFASVQKCFGLPAGLAVMVVSKKAIERAKTIQHHAHYNNLNFMVEMAARFQTTYTPNVLGIYLLNQVLKNREKITIIHKETMERYESWMACFNQLQPFELLIENKLVQSPTVFCLKGETNIIQQIKKQAANHGFIVGEGYGNLKSNSFRIANFPAIQRAEIKSFQKWLRTKYS